MRLRELLDLVKARYDLDTDYKACKILQVSQSRVSKALKSDSIPDDDLVLQAEQLLKMPPGSLLLEMHAERTNCKKAAQVLRDISKQIGSAAAALMLTLSMIYATAYPTTGHACPAFESCNTVYYVK